MGGLASCCIGKDKDIAAIPVALVEVAEADNRGDEKQVTGKKRKNIMDFLEKKGIPRMDTNNDLDWTLFHEVPRKLPFCMTACFCGRADELYKERQGYGKVHLRIWEAKDLPTSDVNGFSDPYIRVSNCQGEIARTQTRVMNLSPKWKEEFIFSVYHPNSFVKLEVFDYDLIGHDDLLGDLILPLRLMRNRENVRGWFHLEAGAKFEKYESREHSIVGYCGRVSIEVLLEYNPMHERALRFIPEPEMAVHQLDFDINDLFAKAMRIKEIFWDRCLMHLCLYIQSVMVWENPRHTSLVLGAFLFFWWFPFAVIPTALSCILGCHLWVGWEKKTVTRRRSSDRKRLLITTGQISNYIKTGIQGGVDSIVGGVSTIHEDMLEGIENRSVVGTAKGAIVGIGGAATGTIEGTAAITSTAIRGAGGILGGHVSNRPKATNVFQGAFGAGAEMVDGVDRGVKSLIRNSLEGAREGGARGFVKGVGTGVLEAGQGVAGGVLNAAATTVDGMAATPGAVLKRVGLSKNHGSNDDEKEECESLSVWVRVASGLLPSTTKHVLALQRRTLLEIALLLEKTRCIIQWEKRGHAIVLDLVLGALLVVALIPDLIIDLCCMGYDVSLGVMPDAARGTIFLMQDVLWALIPSTRSFLGILVLLGGFAFFTCRTPVLEHFFRLVQGVALCVSIAGKPGLASAVQFSKEDARPTSFAQFHHQGNVSLFLDEWIQGPSNRPVAQKDKQTRKLQQDVGTATNANETEEDKNKVLA